MTLLFKKWRFSAATRLKPCLKTNLGRVTREYVFSLGAYTIRTERHGEIRVGTVKMVSPHFLPSKKSVGCPTGPHFFGLCQGRDLTVLLILLVVAH